ncbi:MAG: hypothetical protein ABEI58_01145 [Candidatus Nanohaloarchaea archaeon]
MAYSYLDHVEAELLAEDDEKVMEEADSILGKYFQGRPGQQYRAFVEDDLRYVIIQASGEVDILEEEGTWQEGDLEVDPSNNYRLIYRENGRVKSEEAGDGRAETLLSSIV